MGEKLKKQPRPGAAASGGVSQLTFTFESSDPEKGSCKVQFKPQKGRSSLVVLLVHDGKKYSQKLQVVVKPDLPKADCLAIVKFIGQELIFGSLPLEAVKTRRVELQQKHEKGELLQYFKHVRSSEDQPPYGYRPDDVFFDTYERDCADAAADPHGLDNTEVPAEVAEA